MQDTLPLPRLRTLGATQLSFAPIAWGMWRLADVWADTGEADRLVRCALDAGITLLDTADIYGFDGEDGFGMAETILGRILAADRGLRGRMILATKGGIRPPLPYDQSPAYLAEAVDASLRRLQVEQIDLYQIHRPDILARPQETARALEDGVSSGKIRALGVSNFTPAQIEALAAFLTVPLATTQPEISALRIACFENGELDQAMRLNMTPLAWSPLAGGRLLAPETPREVGVAAALDHFTKDRGIDRSIAAYSWLMAHPSGIVPIVGSQNPRRIADAAKALEMQWSRGEWYRVFVAARGEPLP